MGEHTVNLPASFDGRLRLALDGTKVTNNAALRAFRELDQAFGLTENASAVLSDRRHGKNT